MQIFVKRLLTTHQLILNCQKLNCPLLNKGLPLLKSVIQPFAESVLAPLGLMAAASAADAGIHKKILGSGYNTTLIISNDEMKDILKIVKFLEDSGFVLVKQLKMKQKNK